MRRRNQPAACAHLQRTRQATRLSAHFAEHTVLHGSEPVGQSPRRRCRSKHSHGHLPIDAGAVIGDAGETIFWPVSFMLVSFFSVPNIGQVHFSNMK